VDALTRLAALKLERDIREITQENMVTPGGAATGEVWRRFKTNRRRRVRDDSSKKMQSDENAGSLRLNHCTFNLAATSSTKLWRIGEQMRLNPKATTRFGDTPNEQTAKHIVMGHGQRVGQERAWLGRKCLRGCFSEILNTLHHYW
jgi:hypothetical protein